MIVETYTDLSGDTAEVQEVQWLEECGTEVDPYE